MADHSKWENASQDAPVEERPSNDATPYTYLWNYGAQLAHDREKEAKKRRKGILVYALSMAATFLVCIALLVGTIVWYGEGNAWSAASVAETVSPATVLIYASDGTSAGYGTGFFIRSDGYIVTNEHVVGGCDIITVRLYTGETLEASYIGGSAADDLALIKVSGSFFPTVSIGDSDALSAGDVAVAIGNPSGADAAWTVTQGIISSVDRTIVVSGDGYTADVRMIQTDAALNPGNSGGPLCDRNGAVVGIVARKLTDYEGMSFAIPINEAMHTIEALLRGDFRQSDSLVASVRPTIGVTVQDVTAGTQITVSGQSYTIPVDSIYVSAVSSASGAYDKLKIGDVIYGMDGHTVTCMADLQELLYRYDVGGSAVFHVIRKGVETDVTVTLGVTK